MRPIITRPEIVRGERFDDYGPPPVITPEYLRPGVDVLMLRKEHGRVSQGSLVLFVGHTNGKAAVAAPLERGGWQVFLVPGEDVDEASLLADPCCFDWLDFREGYDVGRWEALAERQISKRTRGLKPSWYGRGIVAGYRDRMKGVTDWEADRRAFNELMRTLPDEDLPAAMPWERRQLA
jgi:hypothetical protein